MLPEGPKGPHAWTGSTGQPRLWPDMPLCPVPTAWRLPSQFLMCFLGAGVGVPPWALTALAAPAVPSVPPLLSQLAEGVTSSSLCPGVFGQRLEDTVHHERKSGPRLAPLLVEQCVDFIRERGLTEEGLFRMPGQANLVRDLQDSFDCGEKPLFDR